MIYLWMYPLLRLENYEYTFLYINIYYPIFVYKTQNDALIRKMYEHKCEDSYYCLNTETKSVLGFVCAYDQMFGQSYKW